MSVDAKAEIVIERTRADVSKVVFDPKSDVIWMSWISQSFPQASGLVKKDTKVNRDGTFLGRKFSANVVVVLAEPEKSLKTSSDEPFEMTTNIDLADAEGGTLVKLRVQGIMDGQYKQPPAVVNKSLTELLNDDLKLLKRHLELQ